MKKIKVCQSIFLADSVPTIIMDRVKIIAVAVAFLFFGLNVGLTRILGHSSANSVINHEVGR